MTGPLADKELVNESGPLTGRGVVVTRSETPEDSLGTLLQERGARVLLWTSIEIGFPEEIGPLKHALENIDRYDWIIFTSTRAVSATCGIAEHPPSEPPEGPRIAAVGKSTARALENEGWPVHFIPDNYSSDELIGAFRERDWATDAIILFPAGSIARNTVPDGLTDLGAEVDRITVYTNSPASLDREACLVQLNNHEIDAVTFASPSAVTGLQEALGMEGFALSIDQAAAVAIGPTTADALEEAGWPAAAVADPSTLEGLADAVVAVLGYNHLPKR